VNVTRVLLALIGALLIGDLVGVLVVDGDDTHVASGPTTTIASATTILVSPTSVASPPTSVPDPLAQTIKTIEAFVEQHRGLKYKTPVKVELLNDREFKARLLVLAQEDNEDLVKTARVLTALGLLKPGTDLIKARDTLLGGAVIGLYDDESKALLVRGTDLNPYVRTTLAHELTHAIQDQNFNLHRPDLDERDDEASLGLSAMAEGDAKRIEEQYRTSLSKAEQRQAAQQEGKAAAGVNFASVPAVLFQFLAFPYAKGGTLVDSIVKAGGQARLDTAFVTLPTTSEQIIHPQKFLAGEGPRPLADPAADGPLVDKGTMGEFVLELMLAPVLGSDDAERAAAGWGGDRYAAWSRGDQTCARINFTMDTAGDLAELKDGLTRWADKQPDATVSGADPLVLTACA
jgi:hypothetical protein